MLTLLANAAIAPFTQFWLDAAAKATVLLVLAMAATLLLRRSSAALRHRIWCLTFVALIMLPGLSAALPEWRLAVLPYSSPLAPREVSRVQTQALDDSFAPQADPTSADRTSLPVESDLARDGLPLAEREGYFTAAGSFAQSPTLPAGTAWRDCRR